MKKRIYQTPDLEALVANGGYYVDKTHFIPLIENFSNPNLFFLRPRRFGKSMLLSVLELYYGIEHRDKFNELFGQFYIGNPENTTPLKNSFHVIKFNFSGIRTETSTDIEREFCVELSTKIANFLSTYNIGSTSEREILLNSLSGTELLRRFFSLFKREKPNGKIYLLIDEYDHFTNELFSFDRNSFKEFVSTNGWVRKFYEVIKQYNGEGVIDRFFATGVTPVTLDSMTSGFNIARDITLDSSFHEMAGFTESELKTLILNTMNGDGAYDIDMLLNDMRLWYNGSRFCRNGGERIYNPQLVLNFLISFQNSWRYPEEITDNNVTSDWKKIKDIVYRLPKPEADSLIEEVYSNESIKGNLITRFNPELTYTKSDAISILFYNGLLTIDSEKYGIIKYVIPNYVIKNVYWEFLRAVYEQELNLQIDLTGKTAIFEEMAEKGEINNLVRETQRILTLLTNNDFQNFRESNLKMVVITLLSLNKSYIIHSEFEVEKGRVDLLLTRREPFGGKYQFLLEFKYVKVQDEKDYEKRKTEGINQLKKYLASDKIHSLQNLKSYLVMFHQKSEGEIVRVE